MKNFIKTSITTLGALLIFGTSAIAATGTINAPNGLVFREKADKNSKPLATIEDKAEVNVLEKEGEWYKVVYNSQSGYIYAKYVTVNEEITSNNEEQTQKTEQEPEQKTEQEPEQEQTTETGTKSSNILKVYNMPLITSTVINEIPQETEIKIEKQITNWSYVVAGELQGWVRTYGISGNIVQEQPQEPVEQIEETENNTENVQQKTEDEPQEVENNTDEPTQEIPEQTTSENKQEEKQSSATKGTVDVDFANIRKEASKDSEIITTLTKDTTFDITAETEEWYKIKYTGLNGVTYEGYIYKLLVVLE